MDPGTDLLDGKYEILEKLGEGGMGAVYKVRHRLLDERRVVKVMRSALKDDPELNERFLREARTASQLRHPNIAQLYDFSIDADGVAYIVMELIEGLTLDKVLRRHGPLPVPLVLELARQSLRALDYLHRRHFVHRDISPDNLMLSHDVDGRPLVKLIDLGIAKALQAEGGLTMTGMFLGKVRYSSPEQLDGISGAIDGRSDLYSFGIVLYELLTGRSPIEGTTPPSLIAGHLFRPPIGFEQSDPDGRVPAELRQVITRSLAKKPDERIESAEVFAQLLAPIAQRYPLSEAVLGEAWGGLAPAHAATNATRPEGSTQERLDQQFPKASATPRPKATTPVAQQQASSTPADAPTRRVTLVAGSTEPLASMPVLPPPPAVTPPPLPIPSVPPPATEMLPTQLLSTPAPQREPLSPSVAPPRLPVAGRRRGGVGWLGVAGVVVLGVVGLAVWLRSGSEPVVALHGTVVVNAIPWAQVTQIRDASGGDVPLPEQRFTPLVLVLAPGVYQVELRSDSAAPPRTLEVRAATGETTRQVVSFSEVATDDFFKSVGW